MSSAVGLDLSGVALRVSGLPGFVADKVRAEWTSFVTAPGSPFLDVTVTLGERVDPATEFDPKAMLGRFGPGTARFEMREGWAEVALSGEARLHLAAEPEDRVFFAFANLLRACLAWMLPSRRGALVHAAGLVVDGRAFLLVGSAGAGKSTWARLGEKGGGRVVSDDLVVVDGERGEPEVLGSPFRSTHYRIYRPGRWPLAGLLFSRHGSPAAWTPTPRMLSRAKIAANLPFVTEAIASDDRISAVIEDLAARVPCLELTFGLDPSFVELLRSDPP